MARFARRCAIGVPPTLDLVTAYTGIAAMRKTGGEQVPAGQKTR
jgi:hypothetical protein